MVFWILIAVMTAAAALSVLVPMSRARRSQDGPSGNADEAVYRDQLSAIEAELKRGLIEPEAAGAARTEIARRLLNAHDNHEREAGRISQAPRLKFVQGLALFALPAVAVGLYLFFGAPDVPDAPLAARLQAPAEEQSVDILVARVERHLAENPEDGQGWVVIAPVYLSIGRAQDSARAYAQAIRLLGPRQDWLTDMGEAMVIANQGLVPAEARQAFEQAAAMDASAVKPRFFLAIALGQEGRKSEAIEAWRNLIAGADGTEAWLGAARNELAELAGADGQSDRTSQTLAPRGPSQEDVAASQDMSPVDRQAMIRSMVSGLAERLADEGGSVSEWGQLMQAYVVLGEMQSAENALEDAQAAFADKPEDLSSIKDAARQLGLTGS
ncbi:c-type cytochrome biogenesis protein CcmI [Labrenzia sp. OB1]|uniref:c-type cytochrome biogenesis protein CcmI n=1 Tax=Labrenzia sp. OB1 TaxID=1561204 RepID=UPI0007B219D7|nr:c-type cytochrome biogenesis protein CcmI [Labrenzia sp. OB1]KZM47767.1 cytochrome C biogenesis protein CycH [Labrenzia sp. OB1]